jgi:hypothetical protein
VRPSSFPIIGKPWPDATAVERVPEIMDTDVFEAGARSDPLPERLEVREPRARFRPHDRLRVPLDWVNLFQNLDRRLTKMHYLGAGLWVWETERFTRNVYVLPLERHYFAGAAAG